MTFVFLVFQKYFKINRKNIFLELKIDNQYLISDSTTIQPIKVYKPDVKKYLKWLQVFVGIFHLCFNSLILKKNGYLIINKLLIDNDKSRYI